MSVLASPPEVKGVSFHNLLVGVERLRGLEAVTRVRAMLPSHLRDALDRNEVINVGWYPLSWYVELHATIREATGEGPSLAFELGHFGTAEDFKGIYRLLRFVLSPQSLIQRAPAVFGRYRRPGTLTITSAGSGFATAKLEHCHGYDASVWQEIAGGCAAVLEACGAKSVRAVLTADDATGSAVLDTRWS
jgi:hypothetical protein